MLKIAYCRIYKIYTKIRSWIFLDKENLSNGIMRAGIICKYQCENMTMLTQVKRVEQLTKTKHVSKMMIINEELDETIM